MDAPEKRSRCACARLSGGSAGWLRNLKNGKPKGKNSMPTVVPDRWNTARPAHYAGLNPDVIAFCLANDIGFCEGNVIKYVCRWKDKGHVTDLRKARDYLDRLIRQQTEHDHA